MKARQPGAPVPERPQTVPVLDERAARVLDERSAPVLDERSALCERLRGALRDQPIPGNSEQGRLADLAQRFGLDPLEVDLLGVLWVAAFEPELRASLAAREAYSGQVTLRAVAALFGHAKRVRLASESPLLLWQMVQEHPLVDGGAALCIDATILAWLEGDAELDRALAGRAELLRPGVELPGWPLESVARSLREGLQRGQRWRVHLAADDPLAARWFAAALGRRLGLPVLDVPAGALAAEPDGALRLHRQAFLDACIPCVEFSDAALSRPPCGVPYPIHIVHGAGTLSAAGADVQSLSIALPAPGADERERLWCLLWPEAAAWPSNERLDLAMCHDASVADIAAVVATAPESAAQAALALRERLRGDTTVLARRLDGGFVWGDLVLPDSTEARLREIAFEARERARVWGDPAAARLFPYGRGLVALFAGPPGTGKTMAAHVIANDLGLDLLAVDLSAVVSKWVGETAQHLQQLLSSRTAQRSVLFFDEADALYAKRVDDVRDAQDRFANLDTSHLMTALEAYPGIVLLASNLKANIDGAFLRRIRHVVDFPKPGAAARLRIWQRCVGALFPATQAATLAPALARVAGIEASGAVIKSAALSALFAARRTASAPDVRLLGEMLARELGKEGAGLSARELDALLEPAP